MLLSGHRGVLVASSVILAASFGLLPPGRAAVPDRPSRLGPAPDWTAEGNQADAFFGNGLAAADVNGDGFDDVLVGAGGFDGGESNEGRISLFLGSSSGPEAAPSWSFEGNRSGAELSSVYSAGDVNGDGYDDVLLNDLWYSDAQGVAGRFLVFMGSAAGLPSAPDLIVTGLPFGGGFGTVARPAGDVNGDGYDDVVVQFRFRTALYAGSASGLSSTPMWTVQGPDKSSQFEQAMAAGDLNDDGFDDLMMTQAFRSHGEVSEGAVFIYKGSATGPKGSVKVIEGGMSNAFLGIGAASAGDLDADGFGAIAVASADLRDLPVPSFPPHVFIFEGSRNGVRASAALELAEPDTSVYGFFLGSAGDLNGDGYGDLFICGKLNTPVPSSAGRLFLYLGSPQGLDPIAAVTLAGTQSSDNFGAQAAAGDVNGDGYDDLITGATAFSNDQSREGQAYVFYGGPD
ncbi:MAG TPA: FG-GAP and VCBS repeat-containing protein [Candidatus Polarisedimenticolia bacterium]|nr:FG-GAP and VCBS repeat-containing protein [Candidatus Polarisedimenticolia bacterium]